jgi:hypothetical protein
MLKFIGSGEYAPPEFLCFDYILKRAFGWAAGHQGESSSLAGGIR